MALPIAPTPKLNAKETDKFLQDVEKGLKHAVGYTPTPKLSAAKKPSGIMQPNARNSFSNTHSFRPSK